MDSSRRDFLKFAFMTALAACLQPLSRLFAKPKDAAKAVANSLPDLVAVKGGSPQQMFETGIKALGGMGRFVKKGQTVLVKPNIGWDRTPAEGANTKPRPRGQNYIRGL